MSEEEFPKQFEKSTNVLPFTKYGVSTVQDILESQYAVKHIEHLKKIGLSDEDIQLYHENETGASNRCRKISTDILQNKLKYIYEKINSSQHESNSSSDENDCSPSHCSTESTSVPSTSYIPGHPMNNIHKLEQDLFGHLKGEILSITKRRKMLRRLERRKERIASQNTLNFFTQKTNEARPGSLWDVKEVPKRETVQPKISNELVTTPNISVKGPTQRTMYTVKDNRIVRLEPLAGSNNDEYRSVDIVVPVNAAEERLLEGTKMSLDDIKKMERFKDYSPGIPTKILYLKNISPSVTQEQLSVLFNQFIKGNGGPIDVRLMTGRMRGQAFVHFQDVNIAINALDEINGTILSGRPIIAQFGRSNTNIQDGD